MGLTVGPAGVAGGRYGGDVAADPLAAFSEPTRAWFASAFAAPTAPQSEGWPAIAAGDHTLVCAPTGTGKTLAAFLWAIDRLMSQGAAVAGEGKRGCFTSPRCGPWPWTWRRTCGPRCTASGWPPSASAWRFTNPPWGCAPATPRPTSAGGWCGIPRTS